MTNIKYIFYGTGPLAESTIYALYQSGLIPTAIITKPDAPVGRAQTITPPIIKTWAISKGIKVLQPDTLKNNQDIVDFVLDNNIDIAIVASYGKIIPEVLLNSPRHGTINIHPSMLPLYRGPSPIESQLLDGHDTIGLSIMQLDREMDHGPIYIQNELKLNPNIEYNTEMIERLCGQMGGELIIPILPHIIDNVLRPRDQDHNSATFCKYIEKTAGEMHIDSLTTPSPEQKQELRRKWRALRPWPGVFFYHTHRDKNIRVKINALNWAQLWEDNNSWDDILETVTPEGKSEMDWASFKRGYTQ